MIETKKPNTEQPTKIDLLKVFQRVGTNHLSEGEIHFDLQNDKFIITLSNSSEVLITELSGKEFEQLIVLRETQLGHLAENS